MYVDEIRRRQMLLERIYSHEFLAIIGADAYFFGNLFEVRGKGFMNKELQLINHRLIDYSIN